MSRYMPEARVQALADIKILICIIFDFRSHRHLLLSVLETAVALLGPAQQVGDNLNLVSSRRCH